MTRPRSGICSIVFCIAFSFFPVVAVMLVLAGARADAAERTPSTTATSSHPALAITNVNLVDVTTGAILPRHTVVIRDGRIVGIARVGVLSLNRNLRVVNATGKYLIPGLWDMHVHLTGVEKRPWTEDVILPLYLANGVVGVRDMGGDFTLLQRWRERVENGEITGPHIVTPGPFLDATMENPANTIAVKSAADGRLYVDQLQQRGVDFIKVLSPPREAYFGILEEAKRKGVTVAGHVPEGVSAAEASNAGQASIEHLSGILLGASLREQELQEARTKAIAANDVVALKKIRQESYDSFSLPKLRALLKEFQQNGTWQTPTLVWSKTMSEMATKSAGDARMKYVPAWARPQWDPAKVSEATGQSGDPAAADFQRALMARFQAVVAEMKDAKVPLLAGTDSPDPMVFPGSSLHEELELLAQAGLNSLQALQAATRGPAEFLHASPRGRTFFGGSQADLLLLDANPLDDIRNTRRIFAVIMRGKYYSRQDLDKMLAKVADAAERQK